MAAYRKLINAYIYPPFPAKPFYWFNKNSVSCFHELHSDMKRNNWMIGGSLPLFLEFLSIMLISMGAPMFSVLTVSQQLVHVMCVIPFDASEIHLSKRRRVRPASRRVQDRRVFTLLS